MRLTYQTMLLATAALVTAMLPAGARAQEMRGDTLVVEWMQPDGSTIRNALRDAIALDSNRTEDRVYMLRRGGFYWIEDQITYEGFDLHIVGQKASQARAEDNVCGASQTEDCGPAIIQRVRREDQSVTGVMIQNSGTGSDLVMKNVWIMGQDDAGTLTTYEPLALNTSDAKLEFDGVIFDRNNWHHLGINGANNDLIIRNSSFRNLFGPTQQWEGLGLRLEVGADSVIIENNTFLNIGFTPFQSEAAPANYVLFNHNTLVNVGRSFQAGAIWKDAFVTNNVFVNPFWHGAGFNDYRNELPGDDPYTGFFGISPLPSQYGLEDSRRIVLANNSYWRDPAFAEYYADSIRAQPLVSDTTMGWFDRYERMVIQDNFLDVNPGLATYPDNVQQMIQNIRDLRAGVIPAAEYFWDPGRDEANPVLNVWPLPEDFSYTNAALLTAGTDGLPLGNLNYFPQAKATYQANRAAFVDEIENLVAAAPEVFPIAILQAERAVLENAEIATAEGFTFFRIEGSGSITWTFDLPAAGTYGLNVMTNMGSETQRGQHIRVNGTALRNNSGFGEFYFCTAAQAGCASPLPQNEWTTVQIRQAGLIENTGAALDLQAGQNTIQIAPSWGYQNFSSIEVVDAAGNVVATLDPSDAVAVGVIETCEDGGYCPGGFASAQLDAGGSVTFDVPLTEGGQHVLRVFYASGAPAQAQITANGVAGPTFEVGADTADVITEEFTLSNRNNTVTISSAQGGFAIDRVQLLRIGAGTAVGAGRDNLPDGYELSQNAPNPFRGSTVIAYQLKSASEVRLVVYDLLGREVRTLVEGNLPAGSYRTKWDGLSASGAPVSSGVYVYRLETAGGQKVRTMVVVR